VKLAFTAFLFAIVSSAYWLLAGSLASHLSYVWGGDSEFGITDDISLLPWGIFFLLYLVGCYFFVRYLAKQNTKNLQENKEDR
jgi:hypothetical protein